MLRRTPLKRTGFKRKRKINYKAKLWKIFSEYIRRRDADENGMTSCISCGKQDHWKNLQAGHYLAKSLGMSIYFDERNVNSQCAGCNLWRHGNLPDYALALIAKHGDGILEELNALRRQTRKISPQGYEELIERYEAKLAAMDAAKAGVK